MRERERERNRAVAGNLHMYNLEFNFVCSVCMYMRGYPVPFEN